jgi:hypothetical protein
MRRLLRAGLGLGVIACSRMGTTAPAVPSAAGTYPLQSVGGAALPAVVLQNATTRIEVTSGMLEMNADHSYRYTVGERVSEGTTVTTRGAAPLVGTYTQTGTTVLFSNPDGTQFMATFTGGNTVTFTDSGLAMLFQKS